MAKISNIFALFLLISIPTVAFADPAPIDDEDPLALAPVVDIEEAPFYPPQYYDPDEALPANDEDFPDFTTKNQVLDFLFKCQESVNMDTNCGMDYHASVFFEDIKPVKHCCKKLVQQGKKCHDLLTRYILRFGKLGYDRKKSLVRSENVWKHCSRVAAQ